MSQPAGRPILEIEALEEYPTVIIGKTAYALCPPDALTLAALKRFTKLAPQIDELFRLENPTPEQEQELSAALDRMTRLVLEAPEDVYQRLTDVQRWQIYRAFLGLSSRQIQSATAATEAMLAPAPAAPTGRATRPTGVRSSRGSSGSTGATRARGSMRSRSGSSGRT